MRITIMINTKNNYIANSLQISLFNDLSTFLNIFHFWKQQFNNLLIP